MGTDVSKMLDEGLLSEADQLSDEEWLAEIARRAEAALDGEPGIPWEQVEASVRQRLHSN